MAKNRFVAEVTFKHKKNSSKNKMLVKFYRTLPKDVRFYPCGRFSGAMIDVPLELGFL